MSKSEFDNVLAKIPYGVSVVTLGRGGAKVENGLTISWMSQVSFHPPMLMIAVDKLHYSVDLLRSTKNFCVNLLGEGQATLAGRFAKQAMTGDDKLADVAQRPAESGAAILTEAGLSFLGFGVQPPQATWGNIISDGKTYLLDAWWLIVFPGLAIFLAALSFYLAGDALRQAAETRSERN